MKKFDLISSTIINSRTSAIWGKIVDPKAISYWLNGAVVKTTWEPLSTVEFEFKNESKHRFDKGKIVEIVKNECLVLNLWSKDYGNENPEEPYKTVTYDLKYLGNDQTRLTLTVSSFDSEEDMESRREIVDSIVYKIKELSEV